jgi:hypothetical protein
MFGLDLNFKKLKNLPPPFKYEKYEKLMDVL